VSTTIDEQSGAADSAAREVDGAAAMPRTGERERAAHTAMRALLRQRPRGFAFFRAVHLLSRLYPHRKPIGEWHDPSTEVLRFTVPPSLAFPPTEIATLDLDELSQDRPARMGVLFYGLTGPQGVLPHPYTQHAADRTRARDTAMRDFLDLFHHRMLSLFYRAWARHRYVESVESGRPDRLRDHLLDLIGFGTREVQQRTVLRDEVLAYYAGLFAAGPRSAAGLAQLVADYFAVRAQVEQFVGTWRTLTAGGQFGVGADDDDGRLGFGVVGDAVWDPQARVRLRIGPLTRRQFDAFLPGGEAHPALVALARLYANDQVGVEAQLVLARDEVPGVRLGDADVPTLGFGTWLTVRPMARDPDETVLLLC
jgi:type VI secretion system protein ImpH